MPKPKALVDKEYTLKKIPGKGGWTYVAINEIPPDEHARFGWVKVKGSIDSFKLKEYRLMPMGNDKLFLPVRAEIRKAIGKKEGDKVRVVLYLDTSVYQVPEDIAECLEMESKEVLDKFLALTEGQQKSFVDWVNAAKKADTRAQRILELITRIKKEKNI